MKKHYGRVDILVNNAGTIHRDAAEEFKLEDWQQVMQVNLTSVFQLSQLAAKDMFGRGKGRDCEYGLTAELPGGHPRAGVCGVKGWSRAVVNKGPGERVGSQGNPGERDCSGVFRDNQH